MSTHVVSRTKIGTDEPTYLRIDQDARWTWTTNRSRAARLSLVEASLVIQASPSSVGDRDYFYRAVEVGAG